MDQKLDLEAMIKTLPLAKVLKIAATPLPFLSPVERVVETETTATVRPVRK